MRSLLKIVYLNFLLALPLLASCEALVDDIVGPSFNGNTVGISALFGQAGLKADGTSQATIRVEVFTADRLMVDGATVTLTTTLGTLGATSLTTSNGVAITTLTSGTTPGTAFIVATVENVSATTAVPIVNM